MNDRHSKMIQVEHDIETMLTCIEELSRAWRLDPLMHEYVQQNRKDIGTAHLMLGLLVGAINNSQTTRPIGDCQNENVGRLPVKLPASH